MSLFHPSHRTLKALLLAACCTASVGLAQSEGAPEASSGVFSINSPLEQELQGQSTKLQVPLRLGMYLDKASWSLARRLDTCYTAGAKVGGTLEVFNLTQAFAEAVYSGDGAQTPDSLASPYSYQGEFRWQDSRLTQPISAQLPVLCVDRAVVHLFVNSPEAWTLSVALDRAGSSPLLPLLGLRFNEVRGQDTFVPALPQYLEADREAVMLYGRGPSRGWLAGTLLQGLVMPGEAMNDQALLLNLFLTDLGAD